MDEKFNYEESLTVINDMIARAKNNFRKGSMTSMIFWGYLIAFLAVANYVLLRVLPNPVMAYHVWWLSGAAVPVSRLIERRADRQTGVKTHIDNIIESVWNGFLVGCVVFLATVFITAAMMHESKIMFIIVPVILCMIGTCEYITACACRSKSWRWVSKLFMIGAIISVTPLFWTVDGEVLHGVFSQANQMLVLAVCMVLGFVVPGHRLNRKADKDHV